MNTPGCRCRGWLILLAAPAMHWGVAGCAAPAPKIDEAELNLRRVVQAYDLASERRPVRKVEELKRFFKEIGDTRDPEIILTSPRDGQPYVILFGHALEPGDQSIVAYERSGKDGKRYVVTLSRNVKVLSDEEFAAAPFAGGHVPALAESNQKQGTPP